MIAHYVIQEEEVIHARGKKELGIKYYMTDDIYEETPLKPNEYNTTVTYRLSPRCSAGRSAFT